MAQLLLATFHAFFTAFVALLATSMLALGFSLKWKRERALAKATSLRQRRLQEEERYAAFRARQGMRGR